MLSPLNCLCTFVKHQLTNLYGPISGFSTQGSNMSLSHLEKSQGKLVGISHMSQHQNSEPESGTVIRYLIHLSCATGCGVCNPCPLQAGPHMEY